MVNYLFVIYQLHFKDKLIDNPNQTFVSNPNCFYFIFCNRFNSVLNYWLNQGEDAQRK